ncbi:MAG: hypothetical protein GY784_04190 [Gammaproteobacteria bacterium]|nr:hypothetical protein [Gammaproteobacteria bacterium]
MPATKLKKATLSKLDSFNAEITGAVKAVAKPTPAKVSKELGVKRVAELKRLGRDVIADIGKTNSKGSLLTTLDKAVAREVRKNSTAIRKDIIKLIDKKGDKVQPIDYYTIYHDVLKDSGHIGLINPRDMGRLQDMLEGLGNRAGDACSACNLCAACAACGACSLCTISGVGGTVGTGVLGATSGTVGAAM